MILLGFIALLAVNTSCAHRKNIVVDKSPLIELQCHGCRGYCPTFKVRILNNGDLIYEGIRSVEKMGVVTTGITPEELSDLRARVTAADLWHYPERIQSGIMDAPMATLTVFNGDKSHGITGTIDRPKPLLDLEQRIKELTEGHGMRVMKGVAPDITNGSAQQVIVHLKPGVNAGNWLAKFEELNLHLVRQLNADNTWLVSYNPAELKESSLIETLKNSNEVLDVQPNQQTKERN
jgi:hypothetical protein